MFNTKFKIIAFSLLSVLGAASAHASQINQKGLPLLPTNTVLEGAPLYSNQMSEENTVTTYLNTPNTSVKGELHLLPTFSVQEGDALYSYQEVKTEQASPKTYSNTANVVKGKLRLLPTNSMQEGDALYSYQEVKDKDEKSKAYTEITKSNSKTQKTKKAC